MNSTKSLKSSDHSTVTTEPELINTTDTDETTVENERNNNKSNYVNILALSLAIDAKKTREIISLELPTETLDNLDDLLLDIRREMLRRVRSLMQTNDVINFCLSAF